MLSRVGIYIFCNSDVFSVVNMYFDYMKFCINNDNNN